MLIKLYNYHQDSFKRNYKDYGELNTFIRPHSKLVSKFVEIF